MRLKTRWNLNKTNFTHLGVKLETYWNETKYPNAIKSIYTCPTLWVWLKCPECGLWFRTKQKKQKYCSIKCGRISFCRKQKEENLKQTFKVVNNQMIKEFLKNYNNFIYSEIYRKESQYHETLIDYYNEYLPRLVYLTRNIYSKNGMFGYLRKVIENFHYSAIKKYQNEDYISDCSIKTQIKILGEYNERE